MREIKVRGLSVEQLVGDDQWIYGFGVDFCEMVDGPTEAYLYTDHGVYKVHPESVGQYTGLKDKNEKEIYEGDLLSDVLSNSKSVLLNTIIFEDGAFKHQFHNKWTVKLRGSDKDYMFGNTSMIFEVIGNVVEHPHLLEGRDET